MVFGFEDIGADLPLLPLASRRALDVAGRRLSLVAWQGLAIEARRALVAAGARVVIDVAAVHAAIVGADPPAESIAPDDESRLALPPASLAARLADRWPSLSPLDRFALAHLATKKRARLEEALSEIVGGLSHIDERGQARMVDVGPKAITQRVARARAVVRMSAATARLLADGAAAKGDVLAAARIAGIGAAKRTPELIPLCHGIALTRVAVDFEVGSDRVTVHATAEAVDRTGVEMEAMVAASVAALTIYDMLKAVERGIAVEQVVLMEKSGGRSGHWRREEPA